MFLLYWEVYVLMEFGREFAELELVVNYGCLKIVEVKSL